MLHIEIQLIFIEQNHASMWAKERHLLTAYACRLQSQLLPVSRNVNVCFSFVLPLSSWSGRSNRHDVLGVRSDLN